MATKEATPRAPPTHPPRARHRHTCAWCSTMVRRRAAPCGTVASPLVRNLRRCCTMLCASVVAPGRLAHARRNGTRTHGRHGTRWPSQTSMHMCSGCARVDLSPRPCIARVLTVCCPSPWRAGTRPRRVCTTLVSRGRECSASPHVRVACGRPLAARTLSMPMRMVHHRGMAVRHSPQTGVSVVHVSYDHSWTRVFGIALCTCGLRPRSPSQSRATAPPPPSFAGCARSLRGVSWQ